MRAPSTATVNAAGSPGTAYARSVVVTVTASRRPASTGRTMPARVTSTGTALPSAGNGPTRTGATAEPGRTREPSGPTSTSLTNSTASGGGGEPAAATRSRTWGAPAISSGSASGGVRKAADCPGRSAAARTAPAAPPSSESTPPRPGRLERAAGFAPGGRTTACSGPSSGNDRRCTGVPSSPG